VKRLSVNRLIPPPPNPQSCMQIQTDDVSHLLLLNRRSQGVEPTLFAAELEKFSPYQHRISAALASQSGLLDEMAALIKQAENGRGVRDAQRKMGGAAQRRDDLDRRFRAAYEGYMDARSNLEYVHVSTPCRS
jgi:hypothetical protein